MHLILVVPCYNEEARLDVEAFRSFELPGSRVDFCFVNDGSTDGTIGVLRSLESENAERFSVVDLERNRGKAEAVRRGIAAVLDRDPAIVGFWDADLATPLSELVPLMSLMTARPETEMLFASRVRLMGRDINRHAARHYFGRVGATLISTTLGLAIYDTQCGAKLFRTNDTMRQIFSRPFLSRWIFDVEIIARFIEQRGRREAQQAICEHPVSQWHDVRGSKIKSHDFLRALRDLWRIRRAYRRTLQS